MVSWRGDVLQACTISVSNSISLGKFKTDNQIQQPKSETSGMLNN